ncbi:carbohydrate kinase family protein [Trichococcus ilyis]|uniref:Fructokinase n=1 Tax=Trichococcus ilyis TaxID=640938 RepID=A0A143YRK5_9LACT|nr:carbohydrate kinase [Trichococcus ilyis]CZQ95022.1 ribokinase [Trichococcus ilyis]SEJ09023.1 fructokinase [Trichococcus ilyis]
MRRVYTIGELLIDFFPNEIGVPLKEVSGFTKQPGGAPANVAVTVSRLGGKASFIGKLGQDAFGDYLADVLEQNQVDSSHLFRTAEANTALAFVSLQENGEREFSFYRNPSADMLLDKEELRDVVFTSEDILHFCSVDLIEAPVKYAHLEALEKMKQAGGTIVFDPNVRLNLWPDPEMLKRTIQEFLSYADILKISDDELAFITGLDSEEAGIAQLLEAGPALLIYTKGSKGADLYFKGEQASVAGVRVKAVDTTGAGDSFIGAFLYQIAQQTEWQDCSLDQIREMGVFANRVAALVTTRPGGMQSIPTLQEVQNLT